MFDKDRCTGCLACFNICPKAAINVELDKQGFICPTKNEGRCNSCYLCEKICPSINPASVNTPYKVYALQAKDNELLLNSESGGAFMLFANKVLSLGGVVFGVGFDEKFNFVHMSAANSYELNFLQESKYIQSNINYAYRQVANILLEGRHVLFCAAPCQIAALKNYLGKEYDNLIMIDILCRGRASNEIFKAFLDLIHIKHNAKVKSFTFTDKKYGWRNKILSYTLENGVKCRAPFYDTSFGNGIKSNIFVSASCENCKYKSSYRVGDISIGDYWCVPENKVSSLYKSGQNGISLVLVNNRIGKKWFELIKDSAIIEETSIIEAQKYNNALKQEKANPMRKMFFTIFKRNKNYALTLFNKSKGGI